MTRKRRVVPILIAVAVLFAIGGSIANALAGGEIWEYDEGEVHVYVTGAERLRAGTEVYRPGDVKPFTYPPALALAFVPMTLLPHSAVRPVWYALNALMLIWIVVLLRGVLRRIPKDPSVRPMATWGFVLLVVLLAGRHVNSVFENQSSDMPVLLAAMFGVAVMVGQRYARAAIGFGLGAASKATPLLFLPMLAWQRRFGASIVLALTVVAALLGTELLFPREDGALSTTAWLRTFVLGIEPIGGNTEQVGNAWAAWNIRNQNLGSMIYRLAVSVEPISYHTFDVSIYPVSPDAARKLMFGAQVLLLAMMVWALRPFRGESSEALRAHRYLGFGSVIVCGMVLLSPMSSKSHFCVLLLPVAYICYEYCYRWRSGWLLGCMIVLLGVTLTSKGIVGKDLGYEILARGSVTWATLAALLGSVLVLERGRRAESAEPE